MDVLSRGQSRKGCFVLPFSHHGDIGIIRVAEIQRTRWTVLQSNVVALVRELQVRRGRADLSGASR